MISCIQIELISLHPVKYEESLGKCLKKSNQCCKSLRLLFVNYEFFSFYKCWSYMWIQKSRPNSVFRHFDNIIWKWSGLIGNMTPIILSKPILNRFSKQLVLISSQKTPCSIFQFSCKTWLTKMEKIWGFLFSWEVVFKQFLKMQPFNFYNNFIIYTVTSYTYLLTGLMKPTA